MTREQGKRKARVIPETCLSNELPPEPFLDRATQARIGDQLRAMYEDLMQQPVPDRLKDILARLDQRDEDARQ